MKNSLKIALGVATAVAGAGAVTLPSVVGAWGDNGGGRPSYTIDQINKGELGDKIVFNSISNSTIGDEKNFVGARDASTGNNGAANVWNGNDITVEDGKYYLVRIYAHNNSPKGYEAVAKDTAVSFQIPKTSGKSVEVNGFITSSNATPSKYWDYVKFNSNVNFHLEYVKGSALLENNGIGANGGIKLSDSVVGNYAKIGYSALNGEVPGCYQYANYVTIKVKAVYDYNYDIAKTVRKAGTKDWSETLAVKVGDTVEYQIAYKNTEAATVNNVMVKDVLPNNVEYVKGSTVLYNAAHASGAKVNDDKLVSTGINIGNYTAGSNAYIRFQAKVVDKNLACGDNTITNWGQIGVGQTTKQDAATITVKKTCDKPTPTPTPTPDNPTTPETTSTTTVATVSSLPQTGATLTASGIVGVGATVTAAGYYIASRKKLH